MLKKLPLTIFLFPERHFGESEFGRSPTRPPPTANSETKMEEHFSKALFLHRRGSQPLFLLLHNFVCSLQKQQSFLLCLPLASPFSALQAPTSATSLSSKCVSSPRNGRSQSAALGRPKKNITVKIRFFHHWYFHLNINRRNNLTCFLHAFLNLLNQWNL